MALKVELKPNEPSVLSNLGMSYVLDGDLRTGILSLIGVAPIALILLLYAYRAVPQAEATIVERANA